MKHYSILVVCKYSKIEYDKKKYSLSSIGILRKYKAEGILYKSIIASHKEQIKCISLVKSLLPDAMLIYTPKLSKKLSKGMDLVISVGGDEHFKYVIHNTPSNVHYLNVRSDNLKSEGALSSCNRLNLKKMIDQLYNDAYKLEKWVRLSATLDGKPLDKAIGTIFIGSKNATRMSRYIIKYKGEQEEQKSSGVLIVTGSGSTGWYNSAGGKHFPRYDKLGKFIAREIYIGSKSSNKIRQGTFSEHEYIELISLMNCDGIVEIDSVKEYEFRRGASFKVFVSNSRLSVISMA